MKNNECSCQGVSRLIVPKPTQTTEATDEIFTTRRASPPATPPPVGRWPCRTMSAGDQDWHSGGSREVRRNAPICHPDSALGAAGLEQHAGMDMVEEG